MHNAYPQLMITHENGRIFLSAFLSSWSAGSSTRHTLSRFVMVPSQVVGHLQSLLDVYLLCGFALGSI
jgi:hypothetical protein